MKQSLGCLIEALVALPGIGRKSAQRIALYLLCDRGSRLNTLMSALEAVRDRVQPCSRCFNLAERGMDDSGSEAGLCEICTDPGRNRDILCVVEGPGDVLALEQFGQFRGLYHVLGGVISPIDNIGPEDLHVRELIRRVETEGIKEVIIATNPTSEGEATAVYLARLIARPGLLITRIARGLPVGSELELADEETLRRAFEGRREM